MNDNGCAVACMLFLCTITSCSTGACIEEHRFKREAVEQQYAEYDSSTGAWKWKEKSKP